MRRKRQVLMALAAVALPLSTGLFIVGSAGVASAVVKYNNVTDTVQCAGVTGTLTVSPALTGGTPTTATGVVKAEFWGCQDGNGALNLKGNTFSPTFTGKVAGTLDLATNSLTALQGCDTITGGALTTTWNATAGATEPLQAPTTVLHPSKVSGAIWQPQGATDHDNDFGFGSAVYPGGKGLGTDGYGSFLLGDAADSPGSCTGTTGTESGGFTSGGHNSAVITTAQDGSAILDGNENAGLPLKSIITIGIGEVYVGS